MGFDVTTAEFQEKILDASKKTPVVAVFWATWCGPCKSLKPKLEKLSQAMRFPLARVNAPENREIVLWYSVRGVPVVKVFYNGKVVGELAGDRSEGDLRDFLAKSGVTTQLEF